MPVQRRVNFKVGNRGYQSQGGKLHRVAGKPGSKQWTQFHKDNRASFMKARGGEAAFNAQQKQIASGGGFRKPKGGWVKKSGSKAKSSGGGSRSEAARKAWVTRRGH